MRSMVEGTFRSCKGPSTAFHAVPLPTTSWGGQSDLTRPDVLRLGPRPPWLDPGEIGFAVGQTLEPLQLVPHRIELADQQPRRRAVPVGRPVGVDDDDAAAALQGLVEVPEELER